MKKTIFALTLLLVTLLANAQQVQNPGFENWTSSSNVFPLNWGSYSQALVGVGQPNRYLEVQTSTAHSGSYAILLQNQNLLIAGGNNVPGGICNCPITYSGHPVLGFGPYNSSPTSYNFWYQFNAVGGDNAYTQLYLTKWNSGNNKRDTLASAYALISGPTSAYTQMTVPINWLISGQTPDSLQLSFVSSVKQVGGGIPTGGMLYIDDVNMNVTTGIENITTNNSTVNIYPNPNNGNFIVETNSNERQNVQLFDINGKLVLSVLINGKTSIDVTGLEEGIYTLTIKGANGIANKKLVISAN